MNFHFFLILLLFAFSSFAQSQHDSIQQMMVSGDSLFNVKDFEQAKLNFDKVKQMAMQFEDWDNYLQAGYMSAQCFQKSGDIPNAIKTSVDLIAKADNVKIQPSKTLGDIWHKLGVYYYIADDYDNAREAYAEAIEIRAQLFGEMDLDLSRSYHNLGVAYFAKNNYDAAIDHLRTALSIRKDGGNPVLMAQTYQELGIVCLSSGDFNKGLEYQGSALSIWRGEANPNSYNIGRAHLIMGILNYELKNYAAALANYNKAKIIFIDLFGEMDSDVADCYTNIANTYDDIENYEKAVEYYQKSLEINRNLVG